jgi:hypothetical protein
MSGEVRVRHMTTQESAVFRKALLAGSEVVHPGELRMPADRSVDLAALDALYQAATPGEWRQGTRISSGIIAGRESVGDFLRSADAALIAALHNAWPALRLAYEAWEADCEAVACWKAMEGEEDIRKWLELSRQQQAALARWNAARAKLRALREAQNG